MLTQKEFIISFKELKFRTDQTFNYIEKHLNLFKIYYFHNYKQLRYLYGKNEQNLLDMASQKEIFEKIMFECENILCLKEKEAKELEKYLSFIQKNKIHECQNFWTVFDSAKYYKQILDRVISDSLNINKIIPNENEQANEKETSLLDKCKNKIVEYKKIIADLNKTIETLKEKINFLQAESFKKQRNFEKMNVLLEKERIENMKEITNLRKKIFEFFKKKKGEIFSLKKELDKNCKENSNLHAILTNIGMKMDEISNYEANKKENLYFSNNILQIDYDNIKFGNNSKVHFNSFQEIQKIYEEDIDHIKNKFKNRINDNLSDISEQKLEINNLIDSLQKNFFSKRISGEKQQQYKKNFKLSLKSEYWGKSTVPNYFSDY